MRYRPRTDVGPLDLAQFEHDRIADMLLLDRHLADIELPRLAIMIGETLRPDPLLGTVLDRGDTDETLGRVFARTTLFGAPAIGLVIGPTLGIAHRHMPVLLEMGHRAFGRIDGDMRKVGAAQPLELRIEIGEIATLQQRIIAEVDARRHILGAESDLLGFGKEIVDHPIKHQPPDDPHRHQFFGD